MKTIRPGKSKETPPQKAPQKGKTGKPKREKKEIQHWEPLRTLLAEKVLKDTKPHRVQIHEEIFRAALQLVNETPGTLNLKITANALKELRYSFKMFYEHRFSPKITMFGSARVAADTPLYHQAKAFAEGAVERGYMVMTGGGPGIMAAGNEGAQSKGFGLNIRLPFEQDPNPYIEGNLINYKYFFTRKLFLVKEAAAFAFFPGGFGTFDEAFEVLTLLQTGKTSLIPVVLLEPEGFGYWKLFSEFIEKALVDKGFISPLDKTLFHIFRSAEDALDHIHFFYRNYHSIRFVKQGVVVRLKKKLSPTVMKALNREFTGLASGKSFVQSAALPEEANEPELDHLTRLVFPFDRKDYGRLRTLVDFINENTV